MYADRMSPAMKEAIDETNHRREVQQAFNEAHGITPRTVSKAIDDMLVRQEKEKEMDAATEMNVLIKAHNLFNPADRKKLFRALEKQMTEHAERLEFEEAAAIRDTMEELKRQYGN